MHALHGERTGYVPRFVPLGDSFERSQADLIERDSFCIPEPWLSVTATAGTVDGVNV
jgi:hypothetical protein